MKRVLAAVAMIMAMLLGGAGVAMAHNVLLTTDPPDGAKLDVGPKQVRLVFDQPVRPGFDTVTVAGPGGTYWTDGSVQINGDTVTAPVRELGPAGTYVVGYRILSNDGHPVEGKVTFTLTRPGSGTPGPPPANQDQAASQRGAGGMPLWPWIAGAVVLVGLGVLLAMRLGRSTDGK